MSDGIVEPRTRGHRQRARTRRRLLDAAVDVIGEQGDAFAVSDVTERAGVSNGTFYNYFDDREQLIAAVVPEALAGFTAASAASIDHDDPALQVAAVTAAAFRAAVEHPERIRVLVRLDAAQRTILDGSVLSYLRADLERGAGVGRFDAPVDTATVDLVAGTNLLAVQRLVETGRDDAYAARVIAQLLRSLGLDAADAASVAASAVAAANC